MNRPTPDPASASAPPQLGGKYLTFSLRSESYAVDVRRVREIIRLTSITWVPRMPEFVRGVINLRGKIIPVLDLRLRFGLPDTAATDHTCIVVVQLGADAATRRESGLIVDSVEEVLNLTAQEIEETPDFGSEVDTRYLLGVAKSRGQVKLLLDLDRILTADETECLPRAAVPR